MLCQHQIVIYPSLTAFLQDVHCAFPLGGVDDAKCTSSSSSWELLLCPHSFRSRWNSSMEGGRDLAMC